MFNAFITYRMINLRMAMWDGTVSGAPASMSDIAHKRPASKTGAKRRAASVLQPFRPRTASRNHRRHESSFRMMKIPM
jgi:hypothetical protein